MNRRQFLRLSGVGAATCVLSGCLGSSTQSGSGHPCTDPRNIDYDAVEEYRDHGVYLKNSAADVHIACVTVVKESRDREKTSTNAPPLEQIGYEIYPEKEVELFQFTESGRYQITVTTETTTKKESFAISEAALTDETSRYTLFELTGSGSIRVTDRGDS